MQILQCPRHKVDKAAVYAIIEHMYRSKLKAKDAFLKYNSLYPERPVGHTCFYNSYKKLANGLSLYPHKTSPGRPRIIDDKLLKELVLSNPCLTIRAIAETLGFTFSAINKRLRGLNFVKKRTLWVHDDLSPQAEKRRVDDARWLLGKEKEKSFLASVVICDEQWIFPINRSTRKVRARRGQENRRPKPRRALKKFLLVVWWWSGGIIHYDLLPADQTRDEEFYRAQVATMVKKLNHRSGRISSQSLPMLLHENAKVSGSFLKSHGFDVLPHPPQSPDLAPSHFHLFRSLQRFLSDKNLKNEGEIRSHLNDFFTSQSSDFYHTGIHSLTKRWHDVISCRGKYLPY